MSNSLVFVDTNIFVYAYDSSSGDKHEKAKLLLNRLWEDRTGVISVQVLQELSTTLLRKIKKPLLISVVKEIISDLMMWHTIVNDGSLLIEALDICERYKISTWDSLLIAAARRGQCLMLYSEDLQHGQKYSGVKVQNPF